MGGINWFLKPPVFFTEWAQMISKELMQYLDSQRKDKVMTSTKIGLDNIVSRLYFLHNYVQMSSQICILVVHLHWLIKTYHLYTLQVSL